MLVVSAETGYGVEECLDASGDCGATVANALCNAYGEGVALEFGPYEADKSKASNASWPAPSGTMSIVRRPSLADAEP